MQCTTPDLPSAEFVPEGGVRYTGLTAGAGEGGHGGAHSRCGEHNEESQRSIDKAVGVARKGGIHKENRPGGGGLEKEDQRAGGMLKTPFQVRSIPPLTTTPREARLCFYRW